MVTKGAAVRRLLQRLQQAQQVRKPLPRLEVYADVAGEWRWRLIAKNGRTIADSGEGYSGGRAAAIVAARLVKYTASVAPIVDAATGRVIP